MSPQQELLIRVWVETLFVIFHLSVLGCVANQVVRRNSTFLTGFFKLYLAQSVVDVVAYYACLIAYHLPAVGMLPEAVSQGPIYSLVVLLAQYTEYAHYTLHVLISANRLITFTSTGRQTWSSGYRLYAILAIAAFLPLPVAAYNLTIKECFSRRWDCDATSQSVSFGISVLWCGFSCAASITMDMRTYRSFRSLTERLRRKHREDFLLFVFAMLQFLVLLILTLLYIAVVVGVALEMQWTISVLYAAGPYLTDMMCFTAPFFLMSTSRGVRREYYRLFESVTGVFSKHRASSVGTPPTLQQHRLSVPNFQQRRLSVPNFIVAG